MKTNQTTTQQQAEAIQARKKSLSTETISMVDNRPEAASQRKIAEMVNERPVQGSFSDSGQIQRLPEEDEMTEEKKNLQGKFISDQTPFVDGQ